MPPDNDVPGETDVPSETDDVDDPTSADLVAMLEADHRRIARLLDEGAFGDDLAREVEMHLAAETQLLYREMRDKVPDDALVDRCLEVDHVLEEAAYEVDEGDGAARATVVEAFEDHVRMQEDEAFVELRRFVDEDRLVKLGVALETVVRMAPLHPHPRNADEGPRSVLSDAIASVVDHLFHRHG